MLVSWVGAGPQAPVAVGAVVVLPGLMLEHVSESVMTVRAEDQPSWAEVVRRAESGETVSVIAHGQHVADVVPSGELARLRETVEVLSDAELVADLREALADARAGRVFTAGQVAADLDARRAAGE
jgi:antitoxin (DNA-binding transcriptional repressor) of toxin-antitoxin stability system